MKFLKIITIVSFLFTIGVDKNELMNLFVLLFYLNDLAHVMGPNYEIFLPGSLMGIFIVGLFFIIFMCKKYKNRYLLTGSLILLLGIEVYLSGILHYHKITFWFMFPFLVFIASSVVLLIKSFKGNKVIINTLF
jgi:hypothetical protein